MRIRHHNWLIVCLVIVLGLAGCPSSPRPVEISTELITRSWPGLIHVSTSVIDLTSRRDWLNIAAAVAESEPPGTDQSRGVTFTGGTARLRFWNFGQRAISYKATLAIQNSKENVLTIQLNGQDLSTKTILPGWQVISGVLAEDKLVLGENILSLKYEGDGSVSGSLGHDQSRITIEKIVFDLPETTRIDEDESESLIRDFSSQKAIFFIPGSLEYFLDSANPEKITFDLIYEPGPKNPADKDVEEWLAFSIFLTREGEKRSTLYEKKLTPGEPFQDLAVMLPLEQTHGPAQLEAIVSSPSGVKKLDGRLNWLKPRLVMGSPGKIPQAEIQFDQSGKNQDIQVPQNIVLLLLDAARPDHFGCYGYPLPTTPYIDRLSRKATQFTECYAPAPYTLASVASLFTGQSPQSHRIISVKNMLGEGAETLAERLAAFEYQTAAVTGTKFFGPTFGLNQGFSFHEDMITQDRRFCLRRDDAPATMQFPLDSEQFIPPLRHYFQENREKWSFVYIHLFQPHHPYGARINFRSRFGEITPGMDGQTRTMLALDRGEKVLTPLEKQSLMALYDSGLYISDRAVGQVVKLLRETGLWPKTLLTILADHGEAFGEHGRFLHNSTVYDEMIRVPLLMRNAGPTEQSRIVQSPLSLLHLSRALFDLAGADLTSLATLLYSDHPAAGTSIAVTSMTTGLLAHALVSPEYKYIRHKQFGERLYHILDDPRETDNLAFQKPILCGYFRQQLENWLREQNLQYKNTSAANKNQASLEDKTAEYLKSLGYIE